MKIILAFCFLLFLINSLVHGQSCSAQYRSACAAQISMNLAQQAYNDMINAGDPTDLQNIWREITYGTTYKAPGGFYVFVFDFNDISKADGAVASNIGKSLMEITESIGFFTTLHLGDEFHAAANTSHGNWVRYQWSDAPGSWSVLKRSWIRGFTKFNIQYYVGSGFFDIDQVEVGKACQQNRYRECSVDYVKNLVDKIKFDLLKCKAGPEVDKVLDEITYGTRYKPYNGFYAFVYEYTGPSVAHGGNPSFVGLTIPEITRKLGVSDLVPDNLLDQFHEAGFEQAGNWVYYPWTNVVGGTPNINLGWILGVDVKGSWYLVGAGFEDTDDPICPSCNCPDCPTQDDCPLCLTPPDEIVNTFTFKFGNPTTSCCGC